MACCRESSTASSSAIKRALVRGWLFLLLRCSLGRRRRLQFDDRHDRVQLSGLRFTEAVFGAPPSGTFEEESSHEDSVLWCSWMELAPSTGAAFGIIKWALVFKLKYEGKAVDLDLVSASVVLQDRCQE